MEHSATKTRQLNMDLLRIFACFSVVMLHVSAQFWYTLPLNSAEWITCNAYDAVFHFGVPIFVMISGRFFLSKGGEISVKTLYGKYIFRMLAAFLIWNVVYGIWDCRALLAAEGWNWKLNWRLYIDEMLIGRYHLWYLVMISGIYVLLPVLQSWVMHCGKKNMEYFLVTFCVFQLGFSTLQIVQITGALQLFVYQFDDIEMVCSYVGYFVLGYYLYQYPPTKKVRQLIYAGGAVGLLGAVGVGTWDALRKGMPVATAYDSFSIFTFGVTVAIYVLFQEMACKNKIQKSEKLIKELSADTFGIYLLHLLAIDFFADRGFDSMSVNNILGIPLLAVVCFVACGFAAALLRRLPFVGKYIC